MRAITVRQPWAWAIIHGGKTPENHTRNIAGSYRGPVAIHAGALKDKTWRERPSGGHLQDVIRGQRDWVREERAITGAVIGIADLVDVHTCHSDNDGRCCEPWGEHEYVEARVLCDPELTYMGQIEHHVFANPLVLATPIPAKGQLGLWTPDADLVAAIAEQLGQVA